jgi:hypothetical protein
MDRRQFLAVLGAPFAAAAATRPIEIAPGGTLLVDGRRQFVLGLYDPPKVADPWREVSEAGFNLIHIAPSRENFAHCRERGLRCWVSLGSIDPAKRAADEDRIRRIVEEYRGEHALLAWETEDEPAFAWKQRGPRIPPDRILATAEFIRRLDPAHPLYLNHAPVNLESTLRAYNGGAGILATDIYPVIPPGLREMYALWPDGQQGDLVNSTISQVGQYAERMRRVGGPSRAVWMVLQAFAWENLREKDRDPKMVLYPNEAQLRSMVFQSVIHGANGVLFWGLAGTPPEAPLWPDLKRVARELARLAPQLAEEPVRPPIEIEYRENGHSIDRGIEWTARRDGDGFVLFGANADKNPVEAVIHGPAGRLEERFAPFEAKVLRLERQ